VNHTIVSIPARLDALNADTLVARLAEDFAADTDTKHLLLDLSAVTFISSAGIRYLIIAAEFFKKRDGSVVFCGPGENVRQVLQVSGLTRTFQSFPDTDEAIAALSAV
jgi:anti-anti-sigma factor